MTKTTGQGCEKLSKCDLELLGQVFLREIQGTLPAQIGQSKAVKSLHERGYIVPLTRTLASSSPFAVKVSGWELTEAGRLVYCQNCTRTDLRDEGRE